MRENITSLKYFQEKEGTSSDSFDEKMKKTHYVFSKENDPFSSQEDISMPEPPKSRPSQKTFSKHSGKKPAKETPKKVKSKEKSADVTPVSANRPKTPRRLSKNDREKAKKSLFSKAVKKIKEKKTPAVDVSDIPSLEEIPNNSTISSTHSVWDQK